MKQRNVCSMTGLLTAGLIFLLSCYDSVHGQQDLEIDLKQERQRILAIEKAKAASVCVFSRDGKGGGSGVIVSADGLALTNYHVVKPCGTYMHVSTSDGNLHDAVLVGIDPVGDVALIKLLGDKNYPTADWANSDTVKVGDSCFAIGNPFLLATNFEPSVSFGMVSGIHRYQYPSGTLLEYTDCIQTDAAINPGNSGGPLFNSRGHLIGINGRGSFEKRGRVNVGVGYAISINQVRLFWNHLRSGRIVDHATLGAVVRTDDRGRVLVSDILGTSDAWRRGLRVGSEIVSFGGRRIETVNQFKNVLGIYPKGWLVPIEFKTDGIVRQCHVRLQGLHSASQLRELVQGQSQPNVEDSVPKTVAALIENRDGYANYYFNRKIRTEIWQRFQSLGNTELTKSTWKISGSLADNRQLRFAVSQGQAGMQWDEATEILDLQADLADQRIPDGSGGMLVAVYVWYRLLKMGPKNFGQAFYLGGQMDPKTGKTLDVITGRYQSVESRFLFDPDTGQLTQVELWTDPDLDPCVLRFSDFRQVDSVTLPFRWIITSGDEFEWQFQVESIQLDSASQEKQ